MKTINSFKSHMYIQTERTCDTSDF